MGPDVVSKDTGVDSLLHFVVSVETEVSWYAAGRLGPVSKAKPRGMERRRGQGQPVIQAADQRGGLCTWARESGHSV